MKIKWIVILKIDSKPPEFYPCEYKSEAERLYDDFRNNWSEVYLCKVEKGPLS
jgi:hypothetical protein